MYARFPNACLAAMAILVLINNKLNGNILSDGARTNEPIKN